MTITADNLEASAPRLTLDGLRSVIVSLVFITSFATRIEPAPTDFLGLLCFLLFLGSGLHFSRYMALPVLLFTVYIASGLVSVIPISRPQLDSNVNPAQYVIGISYTAAFGFFVAAYIARDPLRRYFQIEKAYWIGAVIGSAVGLLIYFRIQPFYQLKDIGNNELGDFVFRARGLYKDPNVYSTWLVFPFITMLQAFMSGRMKVRLVSGLSFVVISAALLFAFSRGAWIDAAASSLLVIFLVFLYAPTHMMRVRTIIFVCIFLGLATVALVALLSVPSIRDAFADRFVLLKQYDAGENGRFGNQLNSIPKLLALPFGFGPYQFPQIYGIAPHNTFLNAFAAAGWTGGISYIMLFLLNCYMMLVVATTRSAFQPYGIILFSTFVIMALQGLQIDNEHWRHLYWMMGMGWGFFSALRERNPADIAKEDIVAGWLPQRLAPS